LGIFCGEGREAPSQIRQPSCDQAPWFEGADAFALKAWDTIAPPTRRTEATGITGRHRKLTSMRPLCMKLGITKTWRQAPANADTNKENSKREAKGLLFSAMGGSRALRTSAPSGQAAHNRVWC